ncbi:Aste57867_9602 [Aphanomyces stellatus]|uniref:Aste57867_9602 protein n=1 Tax=Aphanomyces stellatus TaxID=120398 RepID=A0A485KNA3_9STRA|nr:hypothetical protein As57867_009564 [Aphanomyces stellatus]VFT86481.1 Aste57867_9602 [Aphanomyces stellatus]
MSSTGSTSSSPHATSPALVDPQYRHFIGGALGGMTAAIITSPLEVVKTRLQTQDGRESMARACKQRLTTSNVLKSILQQESVFGLWRGIVPNLLGVVPARAAYFGCYAKLKALSSDYGYVGTVANFASAATAGCMTASLLSPIFVVKTRMQLMPTHLPAFQLTTASSSSLVMNPSTTSKFYSMHDVALDMYRKEGAASFFKGLSASYWGVSEGAIQLALYEEMKTRIDEPSKTQLFFLAGFCKLFAAAATYPHEVVRTRMRDQRTPTDGSQPRYRSMVQSIQTIYKAEGLRGLYGGMPAHLMKTVPNAAIMYVVLEMIVAN